MRFRVPTVLILAIVFSGTMTATARADGVLFGKVEWISGNVVILKEYTGPVVNIQVQGDARITINGLPARLNQLKPKMHVTIYYEDREFAPVAVVVEAVSQFGAARGARPFMRKWFVGPEAALSV
jgi:hypothetical protein